nr:uncharacterized protein LOC129277538 [Lytechinus pictus]
MRIITEHYSCKNIQAEMNALMKKMKKYSDSTSESVMNRFKATCCEPFVLQMPEVCAPLPDLPEPSESTESQVHHDEPMVSSSEQPHNVTEEAQTPVKDDDVSLPGHSGSADSGPLHSPSSIRSSKRKQPATPRKRKLKERLQFVTQSKSEMKERYKLKVSTLRSLVNYQQINKIKRLNQTIARKNRQIKEAKAQVALEVQEEMNKYKKRSKNAQRRHKRACLKTKSAIVETRMQSVSECNDLKKKLQELRHNVQKLENDILITEESLEVGSAVQFQKEGKTYSDEMRMSVYDHVVNNVPTSTSPP